MKLIFHYERPKKVDYDAIRKEGFTATYVASRQEMARDGLIVPLENFDFDGYFKNSVILYEHTREIGITEKMWMDGDDIKVQVWYASADISEFANEKARLAAAGILKALSISWLTEDEKGNVVLDADALEISLVTVPSDKNAVQLDDKGKRVRNVVGAKTETIDNAREALENLTEVEMEELNAKLDVLGEVLANLVAVVSAMAEGDAQDADAAADQDSEDRSATDSEGASADAGSDSEKPAPDAEPSESDSADAAAPAEDDKEDGDGEKEKEERAAYLAEAKAEIKRIRGILGGGKDA